MNFGEKSNTEMDKYVSGNKGFPPLPIFVGIEIEQAARVHPSVGQCVTEIANPNPTVIPANLPMSVMNRSLFYKWSEGHWDQSTPWEFKLGYHQDPSFLLDRFNKIVKDDRWAWHTRFVSDHENRGASSHVHFSLRGDINLGSHFGGQRTCPYHYWTIYWNDWVTLLPYITPFFAFGNQFRETCFKTKRWAMPVLDRLNHDDVARIFDGEKVRGRLSEITSATNEFELGHKYYALSWNRKNATEFPNEGEPKKSATIELRLCESHPYWFLPAIQKVNIMLKQTLERRASIKLKNHYRIEKDWKMLMEGNVYESLLLMKDIDFHVGRGIPFLVREDQEKVFETGLDLFRAICRRFMSSNKSETSKLKAFKVMRMFSDFIDLSLVPAFLIWDVDEVYRLLYESRNKKDNQDAWLHFGSVVVLPDGTKRTTKENSVVRLLEGS